MNTDLGFSSACPPRSGNGEDLLSKLGALVGVRGSEGEEGKWGGEHQESHLLLNPYNLIHNFGDF